MTPSSQSVHIVAVGAATPIGRSAPAGAAAARAGVTGFAQHPSMFDSTGVPMRVARAPWLDDQISGLERMEALLFPAIDEALRPLSEALDSGLQFAIALGLPAPRPGLPDGLEHQLRTALARRHGSASIGSAAYASGHAAGLVALETAYQQLAQGRVEACVVAGVDSYMMPETLTWLEENEQLHSAGPLNNAWGFIPGEGAGALLLVTASTMQRWRLRSLARVLGVGRGIEKNRIKTDTVCIGEGLTSAFRDALAHLPAGRKITDVYCDMNGEPYRADEYGFTCLRTKEWFESASDFKAPADCWGDQGAATAPLCLGLASIAGLKSYAGGDTALVWASSENGERAAALIETRRPGGA